MQNALVILHCQAVYLTIKLHNIINSLSTKGYIKELTHKVSTLTNCQFQNLDKIYMTIHSCFPNVLTLGILVNFKPEKLL